MMKKYFDLFLTFSVVSLFTLGGGLAMLPLLEREIIGKKQWLAKEEFLDIIGISQSMPGVMILNVATTVGYKIAGARGACAAAVGIVIPPFVSILVVAWFFLGVKDNPAVAKIFAGIRPAVMALVTIPVISLSRAAKIRGSVIVVPIAVALAIGALRINPAYVVLFGLLVMAVIFFLRKEAV
jgi:chromate transporter